MTLRERTISALEAQDKSDLDNLISRCYYEGAVDGATNTCDVYSAKIAEMQKTAEGMRYHNVAKSFIDYDLSKVEGYKGTAEKRLSQYKEIDKSGHKIPEDTLMDDMSELDQACYFAYWFGREGTTRIVSDMYMKEISKTMEKIQDHKYHGMGEKILDMDKPYIYLSDYSMDLSSLFGGDETSLGKDFPEKEKPQEKQQTQEPEKKKDHSRSR